LTSFRPRIRVRIRIRIRVGLRLRVVSSLGVDSHIIPFRVVFPWFGGILSTSLR